MINRRKWARFRVQKSTKLQARILDGYDRSSVLETLSIGGCSFIGGSRDARLLQKPSVRVKVKILGKEFTIDGVIHYCKFLPHKGLNANLFGIEFQWKDPQSQKAFGELLGRAASEGQLEQLEAVEV